MEHILLGRALGRDIPVLGICRGIQFINVFLGGSLYQDLPTQRPSCTEHHQKPPYDVPVHEVELMDNSGLFRLLNRKSLSVNSYHHQAIKEKARPLKIMAVMVAFDRVCQKKCCEDESVLNWKSIVQKSGIKI